MTGIAFNIGYDNCRMTHARTQLVSSLKQTRILLMNLRINRFTTVLKDEFRFQ